MICGCNADVSRRHCAIRFSFAILLFPLLFGCRTWNTERAIAAYNQGNILREVGKRADSISYYRQALEYKPGMTAAAYNLALVLGIDSESSADLELSGTGALAPGENVEEAIELLEMLLRRDPRNLTVLRALGWVSWRGGQPDVALEYYQAALAIFPADEIALKALCEIYEAQNQLGKALENRRYLVKLADDSESKINLAGITALRGDKREALRLYDDALFDSESIQALKGAAEISEELGLYRRAVGYRTRLLNAGDDSIDGWWHMARLRLSKIDDYEGGFEALERAMNEGFSDMELIEVLEGEVPAAVKEAIRERVEAQLNSGEL